MQLRDFGRRFASFILDRFSIAESGRSGFLHPEIYARAIKKHYPDNVNGKKY